jgi:DNA-binding LacI/PurR family transcriptional regulator
LLAALSDRLRREGVHWEVRWESEATLDGLPGDHYPVLWEAPVALADCLRTRRPALLLNARPAPGLDAARLDSVSVDDHFGGACAADLLAGAAGAHFAVLTGPAGDPRSDARRDGFLSRAPGAAVVPAGGWYHEHGAGIAADALRAGPDGVFCVNDRLAEALLLHARRAGLPRPRVVGFDDAPVAAAEDLTTIAIPWDELAADAAEIVRRRLAGDDSAARRRLIAPRPVIRTL